MNINNIIVDHINNGVHKKFIKAYAVGNKINIRYLRSISKLIPISEVFENNFQVKIIHKDKSNVTLSNVIYSDIKLFTENLNKINSIKGIKDKTYKFMFKNIDFIVNTKK